MMSLQESVSGLLVPAFRLHEEYARQLVGDLTEEQMDLCPGAGLENTPRFTIGHLCCSSALSVLALEEPDASGPPESLGLPPEYEELFRRMGPADRRTPAMSTSAPRRDDLLDELTRQHQRVEHALEGASNATLAMRRTWKLSHHLPRIADILTFQCLHEMLHLGQLAAWRRALGLPAAMAGMVESNPQLAIPDSAEKESFR